MINGLQFRRVGATGNDGDRWIGRDYDKPMTDAEARKQAEGLRQSELCGLERNRAYDVRHVRNTVVVDSWRLGG